MAAEREREGEKMDKEQIASFTGRWRPSQKKRRKEDIYTWDKDKDKDKDKDMEKDKDNDNDNN